MLKIFALVLPLYENPRNPPFLDESRLLISETFIVPRTLSSVTKKDNLVNVNTTTPIIGLNWGTHTDLYGPLLINS